LAENTLFDRLKHAWNAFRDRDPTNSYYNLGPSYGTRPDRTRLRIGNERSIVSSVYNRIAVDVSSIIIQHVRLDQNGRYLETLDTGLNDCFTLKANADQTGRALMQDIVLSMFDEGCIAVVPVDTTINPAISTSYDILSLRTGKILDWYPYHIRVRLYNEKRGIPEDIVLPKKDVAVIENPFYTVMNQPNSTLKRLIYKLNILDAIDEQSGSGKLDIIIQLPYVVKTPARREQAEVRKKDLENQLTDSKYGIAYTDATEKVTQLNRPAENNLMKQIEYLTSMLYSQLGLATSILDGTADEKTMINYHNRTIEPILSAITDSMKCKFLTKTGITQGQTITYFRNPFGLVSASDFSTISDSFTRNAILSSNEIRAVIGLKASDDPEADTLRNKNLNPTNMGNNEITNKKKGTITNGK
jgi:hypothetical protein